MIVTLLQIQNFKKIKSVGYTKLKLTNRKCSIYWFRFSRSTPIYKCLSSGLKRASSRLQATTEEPVLRKFRPQTQEKRQGEEEIVERGL